MPYCCSISILVSNALFDVGRGVLPINPLFRTDTQNILKFLEIGFRKVTHIFLGTTPFAWIRQAVLGLGGGGTTTHPLIKAYMQVLI